MYQQKKPSFLFSLYTLDLRWKMKYIGVGWVISFVYWFDHFGDLLHIFCAPVCTPLTRHFTDFIFTEAAEAFYASVLMATYSATLCSCPLVFYFFLVFFDQVYLPLKVVSIKNEFYGAFFFFIFPTPLFCKPLSLFFGRFGAVFQSLKKKWFPCNQP